MNYLTHQLLNAQEINLLKKNLTLKEISWEDGKKTAGNHAAKVKNNLQVDKSSNISKKCAGLIEKKILNDVLIKSFALPKRIHGTMFTKSLQNEIWKAH